MDKKLKKSIIVVAGPNGSGKTTFARSLLTKNPHSQVFLNPDLIASGIAPFAQEEASFQAGRVLLQDIKQRISSNESFGFESTLSGKTYLSLLKKAREQGYSVSIYFLFLDKISLSLKRIKKRVEEGGHNIPRQAVYRRHLRCFENFWKLYRPLCDDWHLFDNSKKSPKLMMSKIEFENKEADFQSKFESYFLQGKVYDKKRKTK